MYRKQTQSFFLYIGPQLYNTLPLDIKHYISFEIKKKKNSEEQNIVI